MDVLALSSYLQQGQSVTEKTEKRNEIVKRTSTQEGKVICTSKGEARDRSLDLHNAQVQARTVGVIKVEDRVPRTKSRWHTLASWDLSFDW